MAFMTRSFGSRLSADLFGGCAAIKTMSHANGADFPETIEVQSFTP
jgi:hypothetical protein